MSTDIKQFSPIKKLGQNFLKKVPKQLIFDPKDYSFNAPTLFIEIGCGPGIVTKEILLAMARLGRTNVHFVGIEKDTRFFWHLHKLTEEVSAEVGWRIPNVLIFNDVLQVDLLRYLSRVGAYTAFNFNSGDWGIWFGGSLPYYVSKKIIDWTIQQSAKLVQSGYNLLGREVRFLVQKEVAQRYVSLPPNADFLSNYLRLFTEEGTGNPQIVKSVDKNMFYPAPQVDGAILRFVLDSAKLAEYKQRKALAGCIKRFYAFRRKTIGKILRKHLKAATTAIADLPQELLSKRPEELTLEEWRQVCKIVKQAK